MSVKCVMVSYALMCWRRSDECEVCNGESCDDVLAAQ